MSPCFLPAARARHMTTVYPRRECYGTVGEPGPSRKEQPMPKRQVEIAGTLKAANQDFRAQKQ